MTMNPTDKVSITLDVQAWQTIVNLLAEAPYRVSAPLIAALQEQFNAQARATTLSPAHASNGHDKQHVN